MLTRIVLSVIAACLVIGGLEFWFWRNRVAAAYDANGQQDHRSQRRSSLLTESLACAGVILVLSGSGVAISQRWLQVTDWERTAILAAAAVCFLISGIVVRWVSGAVQGLTEALWVMSTACVGAVTAIPAVHIYGTSGGAATLAVGAAIGVYSGALWLACRRELLLVAALAGLVGALCGTIMVIAGDSTPWLTISLGLWLFGLAWAALGWLYPEPLGTSICVGAAVALASPAIAVHDHGWVYVIGITTAAAVMAASVPLRNVILLAFGSCALLGYLTAAVINFSHGSLGIAASLMLAGVLLIGMALVTVQLGRVARPPQSVPDVPDERSPGELPRQDGSGTSDEGQGDTAHAARTRHEHERAA